jgi:hypothetical protein
MYNSNKPERNSNLIISMSKCQHINLRRSYSIYWNFLETENEQNTKKKKQHLYACTLTIKITELLLQSMFKIIYW